MFPIDGLRVMIELLIVESADTPRPLLDLDLSIFKNHIKMNKSIDRKGAFYKCKMSRLFPPRAAAASTCISSELREDFTV